MTDPTRYPNGINNCLPNDGGAAMPMVDPTKFHMYFEDFDKYNAADWTITTTEAGLGSATEALANVDGGVLLVTNDDADDDADFFNKVGEGFLMVSGKKARFKCRFAVSDATQSDVIFGLQITDTTPLAVSDGIFFRKSDGAATVDFVVCKNATETSQASVATLVDATYITLEFVYNGVNKIEVFVDNKKVYTQTTLTNLPDDEELTVSFGIQNGEAAAKTLSVDYLLAVKER